MAKADSRSRVSLKEFVESLIGAQKELFNIKFEERDNARKLQADEYARRLSELNHAHEENIRRNAEFVSKEKFEAFKQEFGEYKITQAAAVSLAAGAKQGISKVGTIVVTVVGVVASLFWAISTVVNIYLALKK